MGVAADLSTDDISLAQSDKLQVSTNMPSVKAWHWDRMFVYPRVKVMDDRS